MLTNNWWCFRDTVWLKRHNFRVHVSSGSAETSVRRGEITNHHSLVYSPSNISAKSYQNPLITLIYVEVIVCYISVVFLRHSVHVLMILLIMLTSAISHQDICRHHTLPLVRCCPWSVTLRLHFSCCAWENTMLSTKRTIHNVSQCCHRRTEPLQWITCTKNFKSLACGSWACMWSDKQTDMLITRLYIPTRGRVIITRNAWQSPAYSPLGIIVLPPCKYLWNTPNYWSPQCLTASPP